MSTLALVGVCAVIYTVGAVAFYRLILKPTWPTDDEAAE